MARVSCVLVVRKRDFHGKLREGISPDSPHKKSNISTAASYPKSERNMCG